MKSRYYKQKDGEWVRPQHNDYLMVCCDCGLVHRLNFRVLKDTPRQGQNSVTLQAFRDNRKTAAFRRSHGIRVQ